jgi:hypothetical protein
MPLIGYDHGEGIEPRVDDVEYPPVGQKISVQQAAKRHGVSVKTVRATSPLAHYPQFASAPAPPPTAPDATG